MFLLYSYHIDTFYLQHKKSCLCSPYSSILEPSLQGWGQYCCLYRKELAYKQASSGIMVKMQKNQIKPAIRTIFATVIVTVPMVNQKSISTRSPLSSYSKEGCQQIFGTFYFHIACCHYCASYEPLSLPFYFDLFGKYVGLQFMQLKFDQTLLC